MFDTSEKNDHLRSNHFDGFCLLLPAYAEKEKIDHKIFSAFKIIAPEVRSLEQAVVEFLDVPLVLKFGLLCLLLITG